MSFFAQYPMMRPYVGQHFRSLGTPAVLLVGESHYLDSDIPQRSSGAWYSGNSSTLSNDDIEYISTACLMEDSRLSGFSNKSHSIWSNSLWEINQCGPGYSDYTRIADHIAFYNFFLRPAVDGGSLEYELSNEDLQVANETFLAICGELQPTAVVFLSMLAYNCCTADLPIPVLGTPHPGCAHWNRVAAKYGNKRGRDILGEFIKSANWPRTIEEISDTVGR